ncbi:flagellar motor switch phosphatase FliY, partial [Porcipelethomonas sp.]|uniref:flagellar motor switch phosphatase FliY n=1 Tax=Porcipelethomonas sp. TaxID=2981675 RepID=UPI003EF2A36D
DDDDDFSSVLSDAKRDAIGEIQNIMMGSAATALSNFMNAKVWITTPKVSINKASHFSFKDLDPSICVKIDYIKGIHGASVLVLKQSDVQLMVNQLMGMPPVVTDDFVFDEMNISAVCEIMNQMMGASATTLSEIINTPTDISTPEAVVIESDEDILSLNNIESDDYACMVSFDLTIDGIMNSHFVTMLSIDLANELADKVIASYSSELDNYSDSSSEEEEEEVKPAKKSSKKSKVEAAKPENAPKAAPEKPKPPKPKSRVINNNSTAGKNLNVQEYHIDSLEDEPDPTSFLTEKQYKNLNSLLDVPMDVTVVIGSTQKSIEEVGNFTKGTVIELDTLANEPVDIMVNGNLIARGDVVVVDDNFAIRITEIVN